MIVIAVYAIVVWMLVALWRRRWAGAAVLLGSAVPIAAATFWAGLMANDPGGPAAGSMASMLAGYGKVLYVLSGFYAALVFGVGLLVFVQPRGHPAGSCRGCGYDLLGAPTEICPECGLSTSNRRTSAGDGEEHEEPGEVTPGLSQGRPDVLLRP